MRRPVAAGLLLLLVLPSVLLAGCQNPTSDTSDDADGDAVPDAVETKPRKITVVLESGEVTLEVTSDPAKVDTDGDGASDFEELQYGTDPRSIDTDGDGLLDGKSQKPAPNSEAAKAFLAANIVHLPESSEFLGEKSLCRESGGLRPDRYDSDLPVKDGLSDGDEMRGWTVTLPGKTLTVRSSPCSPDSDGDRVKDSLEKEYGTDPGNADTDGDGVPDLTDPDPLGDLWLTVTVERITVKTEAIVPGGQDLVFNFAIGTGTETLEHRVPGKGTHTVGKSVSVDIPDESGASRETFPTTITMEAVARSAGTNRGFAISPDSPTNRVVVTWDLLEKAWETGSRSGSGSFTTEGSEAALVLRFETVRK